MPRTDDRTALIVAASTIDSAWAVTVTVAITAPSIMSNIIDLGSNYCSY